MIVGPYQSKLTPYTGLPESTSTFTLGLMEESPQLIKNGLIFADLLWVRSQFALNFFNFYFNHNFHTQGDIFWIFFAVRAHIRIFLAFRICINFYPILEIELARPNLPPKIWGHSQGKKLSIFAIFCGSKPDTFYILSICDLKESSEPILPLWGHERPLTRLSKDTLTFDLGPSAWAHKAGAYSALKLYSGRKYWNKTKVDMLEKLLDRF